MTKYYAGIGSRSTPEDICNKMTQIAEGFESIGYILRSGGADGADSAFEAGVKDPLNKEIYLPWHGFNDNDSELYIPENVKGQEIYRRAAKIASDHHSGWKHMKSSVRRLMVRNVFQVFGGNLDQKVDFIICWTVNGRVAGGTGEALRIAETYDIRVYNLYLSSTVEDLRKLYIKEKGE